MKREKFAWRQKLLLTLSVSKATSDTTNLRSVIPAEAGIQD